MYYALRHYVITTHFILTINTVHLSSPRRLQVVCDHQFRMHFANPPVSMWKAILPVHLLFTLLTGCVTRSYTIESEPPGADVYLGGEHLGKTPVKKEFTFYGTREVILRKDGFAEKRADMKLKTPFYQRFPIDLVSEGLLPFEFENEQRFTYSLETGESAKDPDLLARANAARLQLKDVPVQTVAAGKKRKSQSHGVFPYQVRSRSWWRVP